MEKTRARVRFKMEGGPGEETPLAVFLDPDSGTAAGTVLTYARLGQHCEASAEYVEALRDASPAEYAGLKEELERSVGYELEIAGPEGEAGASAFPE